MTNRDNFYELLALASCFQIQDLDSPKADGFRNKLATLNIPNLDYVFLKRFCHLNQLMIFKDDEKLKKRKENLINNILDEKKFKIPCIKSINDIEEFNMITPENHKLDTVMFEETVLKHSTSFYKLAMTGNENSSVNTYQQKYLNHYYNKIGRFQPQSADLKTLTLQFGSEVLSSYPILITDVSSDGKAKIKRLLISWSDVLKTYPYLMELLLSIDFNEQFTLLVTLENKYFIFAANIHKNCDESLL